MLSEAPDPPELTPIRDTYAYLVRAILYQQISGKAAATIHGRLRGLFPGGRVRPGRLLELDDETLRGVGISRPKLAALRDLSEHSIARRLPSATRLLRMPEDEIIETLTDIRGVGRWTVEMLMMFGLGRPDILAATDLGIQQGFRLTFGGEHPSPAVILERGERWRPYRSWVGWYLYRAVDIERARRGAAS